MKRIFKPNTRFAPPPPVTPGRYGHNQGFTRRNRLNGTYLGQRGEVIIRDSRLYQSAPPKVALIVCVYREEAIIPFFLKHYWFVDRIIALLGKSDDRSEELLRADPRVVIEPLEFTGGFNDREKMEGVNRAVAQVDKDFDWVICADSDELLWPTNDSGCRTFPGFMTRIDPRVNTIVVAYRNIYRHVDDVDLNIDSEVPPILQRRHGDPKPTPGYVKPALIRTKQSLFFGLGHHDVSGRSVVNLEHLQGSHWAYADLSFCIKRSVEDRANRISEENYRHSWGNGRYNENEAKVRELCRIHENDPVIVV